MEASNNVRERTAKTSRNFLRNSSELMNVREQSGDVVDPTQLILNNVVYKAEGRIYSVMCHE
jgi:hypothetical protein